MRLNLIDDFLFCIYPIVAGNGLPLFENVEDKTRFRPIKAKIFSGGTLKCIMRRQQIYPEHFIKQHF